MPRPRSEVTLLAVALAFGAGPALAQSFADDAESGEVLSSNGGQWTSRYVRSGNSFEAVSAAAHRDGFGLQFDDNTGGSGGMTEGQIYFDFPSSADSYYLRFWFRVGSSNGQGGFILALVRADNAQDTDVANLHMDAAAGHEVRFAGRNDSHVWVNSNDLPQINVNVGEWYLAEMAVTGMGTTNGRRRLWGNGLLLSDVSGIDWSSVQVAQIVLGEIWSDPADFLGTLDYDDVRGSTTAPASTLRVVAPAQVEAGGCHPFTVTLRTSQDTAAVAPYAFGAALSATGVDGDFFSDPGCSTSTGVASFASGGAVATAYFRPATPGSATLAAAFVDFLPGDDAVEVLPAPDAGTPDAGTPDGGGTLPVDGGSARPVAVVTPREQVIALGEVATLDATSSTAPAGTFVEAWAWSQVEGPSFSEVAGEAKASLEPKEPGDYVFELRVEDGLGRISDPVRAKVTVEGEVYLPPEDIAYGCGCDGAPAGMALWAFALAWAGRVRRRTGRRPGAGPEEHPPK